MKKRVIAFLIILIAGVIGLGIKTRIVQSKSVNGSRAQYQHSFVPVSTDIEERLYGVWQVRGYAGHTRSSRYQWDGLWGDVVIICENALIYGGTPYFNPVYSCYESRAEDMETDVFLDLKWTDRRYAELDGIVILAAGKEKDGEAASGMPYRFILMGKYLMIERGGSYFELEKVGTMNLYGSVTSAADKDAVQNGLEQIEEADQKISNSEKYFNEDVRAFVSRYETEYHHSFTPATAEMEEKLYGVWQMKECIGSMGGSDSRGEGMIGDMIIFSPNAWISSGIPSFNPVYVCYESCADAVDADRFLGNISWLYRWDADWMGKVIAGIETEKNAKYGSGHQQDEPFKMIMTDDCLAIERGGYYFEMQKVGEVEWHQSLLNVEP